MVFVVCQHSMVMLEPHLCTVDFTHKLIVTLLMSQVRNHCNDKISFVS